MRYGFCGFFFCLAFVYGTGVKDMLAAAKDHEALLTAGSFSIGAIIYSFYRALVYPLLGRLAFYAVLKVTNKSSSYTQKESKLSEGVEIKRRISPPLWVLIFILVLITGLGLACYHMDIWAISSCPLIAYTAFPAFLIVVLWFLGGFVVVGLRHISIFTMPEMEMQVDRERWLSIQKKGRRTVSRGVGISNSSSLYNRSGDIIWLSFRCFLAFNRWEQIHS